MNQWKVQGNNLFKIYDFIGFISFSRMLLKYEFKKESNLGLKRNPTKSVRPVTIRLKANSSHRIAHEKRVLKNLKTSISNFSRKVKCRDHNSRELLRTDNDE